MLGIFGLLAVLSISYIRNLFFFFFFLLGFHVAVWETDFICKCLNVIILYMGEKKKKKKKLLLIY